MKEGRLQRYGERLKQYRQNRTCQNNERKRKREYINNWMQEKPNNSGQKYGNQKNITKNQNGLVTWQKI